MDLLNFIFRLGVVFAIFGFIWSLIIFAYRFITIGRVHQTTEIYILKTIQYILLVDVTFLICYDNIITGMYYNSQLVTGALILLMYFMGKLQRNQKRQISINFYYKNNIQNNFGFNYKAEIIVISLAIVVFIMFYFKPQFAMNSVSIWFKDSILDIENTPIFGLIFKIIGLFFLINIIFKVITSFIILLSGDAFKNRNFKNDEYPNDRNNDNFDDYSEIK
jgi:hypothetical protein